LSRQKISQNSLKSQQQSSISVRLTKAAVDKKLLSSYITATVEVQVRAAAEEHI